LRGFCFIANHIYCKNYPPFGLGAGVGLGAGGLLPLPPPDGLPVVLGAFGGFVVPLDIVLVLRFGIFFRKLKLFAFNPIDQELFF